MAVALIAVAVGGPLPAFAVVLVPMVFNAATGHERLLRAGNLANVAAYGWYTLAGGLILQATAPDPTAAAAIGWLILAGLVQQYVNWAIGPAIYGPLWLGRPFRAFVDLLFDTIAAGAVMVVIGAVSVILMGPLDVFALALFAVIAVLPGSFLTYAARTRSVARLERATAARRYAHALAIQLGLGGPNAVTSSRSPTPRAAGRRPGSPWITSSRLPATRAARTTRRSCWPSGGTAVAGPSACAARASRSPPE